MLKILRRRVAAVRGVEFCDACAQVCTAECRSQVRLDRIHSWAQQQYPFIRCVQHHQPTDWVGDGL